MKTPSFSHSLSGGEDTLGYLLTHYVAGTLPSPIGAMVAAHTELTPQSRQLVRGLEIAAGQALEALEPERSPRLDAMFDEIVASSPITTNNHESKVRSTAQCNILPRAMVDFIGYTAENIPWRTKLPGFREFDMGSIDGCNVSMFRIRPGRAIPTHTHEGSELTLVLQGGFTDIGGHYIRGDIAAADETIEHRPVADDDQPCLCFSVTTAPLKLTGSYRQLFSDIFGR